MPLRSALIYKAFTVWYFCLFLKNGTKNTTESAFNYPYFI